MSNKHNYLAKNILFFLLGNCLPKVLSFILIPIYTNYLTTSEYGISDLLTTTISLLIPFFTLNIQDAVMRFSLDEHYKKEDIFSIALRVILAGSILLSIGTIIVSFFKIPALDNSYLFFFVLMYFTTTINNTMSLFCRGIDKVKVVVIGGILQSVATLSANILFLVIFDWGLNGYLLAHTLGSIIALITYFFGAELYKYTKYSVTKGILKEMVIYSFPMVFSAIAWWINDASDRYILTWISGTSVSGLYSISYKIPNILMIFQNIFAQAWSISAVKEFDKNDSDNFISNMYNIINFAMIFLCSATMIANIPIAKILYSNEFFNAWKYVPPLLISVVFNAMYLFIGSLFTAVKDTKNLSFSTIIGALTNTLCNFIFIYLWGAYGAALATMLGFFVSFLMNHLLFRKHMILRIRWKRDTIGYVLLFLQMCVSYYGLRYIGIQLVIMIFIFSIYNREFKNIFQKLKRKSIINS